MTKQGDDGGQQREAKARQTAPARRKRRTAQDIRERLLAAAREEFVAKGLAGATTAAISRRAEVAEIQMFRYFPSKFALFEQAVMAPLRAHFARFNADHGADANDAAAISGHARRYMAELQEFLNLHAELLVSLFMAQHFGPASASEAARLPASDLQGFFDDAARMMAARAAKPAEVPAETVVRIAFGALLGCITYKDWLFPDRAGGDAAISAAITEFILAGIAPHSDVAPVL